MENFENPDYHRKKKDKEKINKREKSKKMSKDPKSEGIQKKNEENKIDVQIEKSKKAYSDLRYDLELIISTLSDIDKNSSYSLTDVDILLNYTAKSLAKIYKINKENLNSAYFPHLKQVDNQVLNQGILEFINSANRFGIDSILEKCSENKRIKDQIGDQIGKTLLKLYKEDIYGGFGVRNTEFIHLSTLVYTLCYTWVIARDLKSDLQFFEIDRIQIESDELDLLTDILSLLSLTTPDESNFELVDLFPVERKLSEYGKMIWALDEKDWKEKIQWMLDQLSMIESEKRIFTIQEKDLFNTVLNLLSLDLEKVCDEKKSEQLRLNVLDSYFYTFFEYLSGNEKEFLENIEKTKRAILSIAYEIDFANVNKKNSKKDKE